PVGALRSGFDRLRRPRASAGRVAGSRLAAPRTTLETEVRKHRLDALAAGFGDLEPGIGFAAEAEQRLDDLEPDEGAGKGRQHPEPGPARDGLDGERTQNDQQ